MSKKYTSADYERLANQYAAKAKELQRQERAEIGEMFLKVYGTCSLEEAERFLRAAVRNNSKYHWYSGELDVSVDSKAVPDMGGFVSI